MAIHTVLQLLLLLYCITTATTTTIATIPLAARASGSGAPTNQQAIRKFPSANCPKKCGDKVIKFPFGIGQDCSRHTGFTLICNNTMQPPRLYIRDGKAEVLDANFDTPDSSISVNFSIAISTRPGAEANVSLEAPSSNFVFNPWDTSITVCGVYTYLIGNSNLNPEVPFCTMCDGQRRDLYRVHGKRCMDGRFGMVGDAIRLKFVPVKEVQQVQRHNARVNATMIWNINDQRTCAAASADEANFACVSKHSSCVDTTYMPTGYSCSCDTGYTGNPYVLGGCSRDPGYNPSARQNVRCSRSCGKIKVPFPFGLEEGCSAMTRFQLYCKASKLHLGSEYESKLYIKNINTIKGFLDIEYTWHDQDQMLSNSPFYTTDGHLINRLEWVIANLTCQEAPQDTSTYACVSPYSKCIHVNAAVMGYRCKCNEGYVGNPYVTGPDGCQDFDECKVPNRCKGVWYNTNGSYSCADCSGEYDTINMKCGPSKQQNNLSGIAIAIGLGIGFGLLLLGLSAIFILRRWRTNIQKQLRRKYFTKNHGLLLEQLISSNEDASERTKIFSLEELKKATNNFDHTRILGRGGHGMVYKGILSDQRVVAIKKSKVTKPSEINQFINEVAILSQINHRNIVKLYGCCLETEVPLLVYDFVPNGSLFEIIHSDPTNTPLSWDGCLRIAAQAAGALYYLHSAASISVFHRDVKSSNILLDANYTAKVSDFGASRLVDIDQTHVTTHVQGTFGYLDPEYFRTGQLNEKSDVYSFGVMLLELLLRRKPVFTGESGSAQSLSSYFLGEARERPVKEMVAAQVREEATEEEIVSVASLAEMCLRLQGEERPTMKEVLMSLQLLHTKRSVSSHATPENGRAEAGVSSHSGNGVDPVTANNQRCYSLEQEFISSASLPR